MTAFEIDAVRTEANEHRNTLPPFDPRLEFDADPHPVYARYRQEDPINWGLPNDPRFAGLWYLFRHEDCHNLFRIGLEDSCPIGGMPSKLGWEFGAGAPDLAQDYFDMRRRFLTAQDPPDHTRVRGAVSQFFSSKRIEECKPRIQELVRELLDEIDVGGDDAFDFVEKLAYPLPLLVVSELMGVPVEDRELVHELSAGLGAGFDVDGTWDKVLLAADAARRFRSVPDSDDWIHRLRIVGIDLRDPAQVIGLADSVAAAGPLDILVNNAAQTVRRTPGAYGPLAEAEAAPEFDSGIPARHPAGTAPSPHTAWNGKASEVDSPEVDSPALETDRLKAAAKQQAPHRIQP